MKNFNKRLRSALALILVVCAFMALLQGCSGTKSAGSEVIDTKNQKFLLINVDTGSTDTAQVTVRLLTKDKDSGGFITAREYAPGQVSDGNTFGLVLEEKGIYEVTATCGDLEPVRHIVEVTKNQLYVLDMVFTIPAEQPETETVPGA